MTPYTIGDVKVHRVVEHDNVWFDPLTIFSGLTAELLEEERGWLEDQNALSRQTGKHGFCVQSYVIQTGTQNIIVDTCAGNGKDRPAMPAWHHNTSLRYLDGLAAIGLGVDDIDLVINTHLHSDHVGWNTRMEDGRWVPAFRNATYLISQREFDHTAAANAARPNAAFVDSVLPVVEAGQAQFVGSDHALDDCIALIPTPGHSIDHFSVKVESGSQVAIITADVLNSPLQIKYPHIAMGVDHDKDQSARTRRSFFRQCAGEALLLTSHLALPSAIRIEESQGEYSFSFAER